VLQQRAVNSYLEGHFAEAERLYHRALELDPRNYQVLSMLGVLASQTDRRPLAAELFGRAILAKPEEPVLHNNLGIALTELQRYPEAVACFDRALTLLPAYTDAYSNRGVALVNCKRFARAFADFDRAIALDSENAQAQYHKALCHLLLGEFAQGWRLYEWRKKLPRPVGAPPGAHPLWLGENSLAGKTLFVYSEPGIGDTIHFCRYAVAAAEFAARVVLGVDPALRRLLQSLSPTVEIVEQRAGIPAADFQVALMSLPLALSTMKRVPAHASPTTQSVPTHGPYLAAEADRIAGWRRRIGDHGLKVGVCWETGPGNGGRCFPLAALQRLATIPGLRLLSLQKGVGTAQLGALPSGMEIEHFGEQLDAGPDAFLDTGAVMHCLDLVITADTATAHLAGALGRPAWLALQFVPDWRWGLEGTRTAWYPTLRLFRQRTPGDWGPVFDEMHAELARSQ
jgi:Tfp pilus assembly protein PilF